MLCLRDAASWRRAAVIDRAIRGGRCMGPEALGTGRVLRRRRRSGPNRARPATDERRARGVSAPARGGCGAADKAYVVAGDD